MDRRYLAAATLAALSAVLHLIVLPLGGFEANLGPSIIGAVIWAVLAFGLSRGSRFTAYAAFLIALVGISGALSVVLVASGGFAQWVWIGILIADLMVAVTLFTLLWRPRPV